MTRILVTGGSGFIGKHLASALIARGRQVRVLDLQPPPRVLPQIEHVRGSVLDRDLVDRAMDEVDEVYHLAGLPGMWVPRKADFHAVNFGGTEIVIETARKRGIKRFLHCSTESILFRASPTIVPVADDALLPDDMPGPYTRSKMLADRFAMQAAASGYPVIIGCPTMPVGDRRLLGVVSPCLAFPSPLPDGPPAACSDKPPATPGFGIYKENDRGF